MSLQDQMPRSTNVFAGRSLGPPCILTFCSLSYANVVQWALATIFTSSPFSTCPILRTNVSQSFCVDIYCCRSLTLHNTQDSVFIRGLYGHQTAVHFTSLRNLLCLLLTCVPVYMTAILVCFPTCFAAILRLSILLSVYFC